MRDWNKRIYLSIFWILIGAALFGLGTFDIIDSFWGGMGTGLIAVGFVQTVRWMRYRSNSEFREKFDTNANDERNRFISNKAWAWAGYISLLTGALGVIVFKVVGKDELSMFCSMAVCLLLVFYWVCYFVLNRKY